LPALVVMVVVAAADGRFDAHTGAEDIGFQQSQTGKFRKALDDSVEVHEPSYR